MTDTALPRKGRLCFSQGYIPDYGEMASLVTSSVPGREYKAGRPMRRKLSELEASLVGEPFLTFYHAGVIVYIRRELNLEENVQRFNTMWREQGDFLLRTLNTRWLLSACDTIIDVSEDKAERATAMCAVTLVNVIKLYETERLVTDPKTEYSRLIVEAPPLFDGVTGYAMGNGDMVLNMFKRMETVAGDGSVAGRIFLELIRRVKTNDTVFRRFHSVHWKEKSKW